MATLLAKQPLRGVEIYDPEHPPLEVVANLIYQELARHPRRVAFAGIAGAGKSTMAELIAGTSDYLAYGEVTHPPVPVFNHADGIKEEVLEWLARSRTRGLIPDEQSTFESFCDFLGLSVGMVQQYMWGLLGPVWQAMNQLLMDAYEHLPPLSTWLQYPSGMQVEAKVAFVDRYKSLFRTPLQYYGQAIKDIGADPVFWARQTVDRGAKTPLCLNADSRFTYEIELLNHTGWTSIYLWIDEETQRLRRPEMTAEQLAHVSENGIDPKACHFTIDATQPVANVLAAALDTLTLSPGRSGVQ